MPKFRYDKLVRDNIPGWHVAEGHTVYGRQLTGGDLKKALIRKFHEEVEEIPVRNQADTEVREELADVAQVLCDLIDTYDLTIDEVMDVARQKADKKGRFLDGRHIESIYMPVEDQWAAYCRRDPEKYPEV